MLYARKFFSILLQAPAATWKAVLCLWQKHCMQYISHQGR